MEELKEVHTPGLLDDQQAIKNDLYTCAQCYLIFPKLVFLKRHMRKLHKVNKFCKLPENGQNVESELTHCKAAIDLKEPQKGTVNIPGSEPNIDLQSVKCSKESGSGKESGNVSSIDQKDSVQTNEGEADIVKSRQSQKQKHTGEKPYKCDICGVGCTRSGSLNIHMRKHTGEKPYKCQICGAEWARIDRLKEHILLHTGDKPFRCDVCGVEFARSRNLQCHMRKHTGEKPYICDICNAAFIRCSSLREHKMTHTGLKPFRCDVCGLDFIRIQHLREHVRMHTGEKPYKCDICGVGFSRRYTLHGHMKTHAKKKM